MKKLYDYNERTYTLNELMEHSLVSDRILAERLKNGWDVDVALKTPDPQKLIDSFDPARYACGNIDIMFDDHVAGVFPKMQPVLGKVYSAEPHYQAGKQKAKLYYIIRLESDKPLIVYPGEFQLVESQAA